MKLLEIFTGLESQTLQKTALNRFELIEGIIGTDMQGEKPQGKDLIALVFVRDDLSRVLVTYPIFTSDKPSSTKYHKGSKECKLKSIGMNNPRESKQAAVSYGLHSPFARKVVKT